MSYLWLPIGLALPTLSGWLLLGLFERKKNVLFTTERVAMGFVLGGTGMMFVTFVLNAIGLIGFTLFGFLIVQIIVTAILGGLFWKLKPLIADRLPLIADTPFSPIQKVCVGLFAVWFIAKIISMAILLAGPAYTDDAMNNWNLRAKSYVQMHTLVLEIEPGKGVGVGSYPPTVPMLKAWLTIVNGSTWNEGLANMIQLLWFVAAVCLVCCSVRRIRGKKWGLIAAYVLSSIPLFVIHGAVPYADLFLSLHVFLAVSLLYHAVAATDAEDRMTFLRLGALAAAMLTFTKNESILLHLPPLLVLLVLSLIYLTKTGKLTKNQSLKALGWYAGTIACVLLPWLIFKWAHGLQFGNAKGITGLGMTWHDGVFYAIGINTFHEGNWALLPALLIGLMIIRFRTAFFTSAFILSAFLIMVIAGQIPIYVLTPLATEALNQTGYARGMIHLVPVAVLLAVMLGRDCWSRLRE